MWNGDQIRVVHIVCHLEMEVAKSRLCVSYTEEQCSPRIVDMNTTSF